MRQRQPNLRDTETAHTHRPQKSAVHLSHKHPPPNPKPGPPEQNDLLLPNTVPRPNRKRLQRRAFIVRKPLIPEPALGHKTVGVGEIACGARGGEDVELDAGLANARRVSWARAPENIKSHESAGRDWLGGREGGGGGKTGVMATTTTMTTYTFRDEIAGDGIAALGDEARLAVQPCGVDAESLLDDGEKVLAFGEVGQGDVVGGGEGAADLGVHFVQDALVLRQMQIPCCAHQHRSRGLAPRADDRAHVPVHFLPTQSLFLAALQDIRHEVRPLRLQAQAPVDPLSRQLLVLLHFPQRHFHVPGHAPRHHALERREALHDAAEGDGLDAGEEHLHPEMVALVFETVEWFAE